MTLKLKLITPTADLKKEYLEMLKEWQMTKEELHPWSLTMNTGDFNLMVETMAGYREGINLPAGFVPQSVFWLVDDDLKILGVIDIRHHLSVFLEERGGHIGYGIRPSERGKGYATKMLGLALKECKKLNMDKVLIICWQSNIASAKIIERNGGVLESGDYENGRIFQRYWITI